MTVKSECGFFPFFDEANKNFEALPKNPYPGRGIVLGASPCGKYLAQIYWIMGRSENSRNRLFVLEENGFLKTKAFDEAKCIDPHLIIYYPVKHLPFAHIVTNGDQTDTVYDALDAGKTFEKALSVREYEDDAPNFTPRISGITYRESSPYIYQLSILKTKNNLSSGGCIRNFYSYERALSGLGHFISTYEGDGSPIPSFSGEPKLMPIFSSAEETLEKYWNSLDENNRVSILVKWIDLETFEAKTILKNKLESLG